MSISDALRQKIRATANYQCGYCRVPENRMYIPLEVEHLFPKAKGGSDDESNLWAACRRCNQAKSEKTHEIDPISQVSVALFNPRTQVWSEHFEWHPDDPATIVGKTACGRATIDALKFNLPDAIVFRRFLAANKEYPPKT